MYKKIVSYGLVIAGMVVLLYLMTVTYGEFKIASERIESTIVPLTKISIYGLLFGVLIEWQKLLSFRKEISINWLIIPTFMLLVMTFIPSIYWFLWFGVNLPFFIQIFAIPETHMVLAVLAGILLVRSFTQSKIFH